ncbi:hypothetical protein [Streptacidiphilus sp. EB129]|uniref:hypothetical protein n=1 Tax=Streptacidiphilus sp. EB129 TaxID=3156262 RepID=UPI003513962F
MGIVTQTTAVTDPEAAADFGSQLQYSLTTVPDPLTVSPASGTVELGDLIIVGSRISPDPVETNQIAVYVPLGTEAWQLALDLTGLQSLINLTGWTGTPDPANERILFKPATGHATLTPEQGITVQLNKLRINRQVGTAPVVLALNWRAPGTTTWRTEEQTLAIGKFPPGFYLRNLKAETYIENGDPVILTWERSTNGNETYHLLYENIEIDVTSYSTFRVDDVRRNTMFYLRGRIQAGTGTAERTINTYVTVNKPDLEVGDLVVNGGLTFPRPFVQKLKSFPAGRTVSVTPKNDGVLYVLWNGGELYFNFPDVSGITVGPTGRSFLAMPLQKNASFSVTQNQPGPTIAWWVSMGTPQLEMDW